MSAIIWIARCSILSTRVEGEEELSGSRFVTWVSLLGDRMPALIYTGSMISIVPVQLLAEAQEKWYDVDSLKVVGKADSSVRCIK